MGTMKSSLVSLVVLCVTNVGLGGVWDCNSVTPSLLPEEHQYWGHLAPLPLGGVDRVIWDGGVTASNSTSQGPGGRWIGLHGPPESVEPSSYRMVVAGDDGGCLELKQTKFLSEAWVHGFTFGEALGAESVPLSVTDVFTLRFRARTFAYPGCDPFEVRLFVHDRSSSDVAPGLLASGSWYIPETGSDGWAECRLTVPLDLSQLTSLDAARWAPRVVFRAVGDTVGDGVLWVDDVEVVIAHCDDGVSGLIPPPELDDVCVTLGQQHRWWLYMCDGDYAGSGADGTSPLVLPPSCPVDVDGDCVVSVGDMLAVISGWGPCPAGEPCTADIDGDGMVAVGDLLSVIASWGEGCD